MAYELYETGQASLPENLRMNLDVNGYVVILFVSSTYRSTMEKKITTGTVVEKFMKIIYGDDGARRVGRLHHSELKARWVGQCRSQWAVR